MNMLRSLYSNKVQEEVCWACDVCVNDDRKTPDHQTALRGLMEAAAGVEPDALLRMREEMEKLRKLFNQTQPEVERATRNVEELIAKHLKNSEKTSQESCEDLEAKVDSRLYHTFDGNLSAEEESKRNTVFGNLEKIQEDKETLKSTKSKSNYINEVESLRSIKSKIDSLVEQEIQRVKNEKELIISEMKRQEEKISVCNKYVDCLAASSDGDSSDEMSVEESILFLQTLKLDHERTAKGSSTNKANCVTLQIEPDELQDKMELYTIEENESRNDDDFEDENKVIPKIYFHPKESNVAPNENDFSQNHKDVNSNSNIGNHEMDRRGLSRIASTWWSTDDSVARDILQKLKLSVECFDNQYSAEASKSADNRLEDLSTEPNISNFELSIEQVAKMLSNISVKINEIYSNEQNTDFHHLESVKEQLFDIATIFFSIDNAGKDEQQMMLAIKEMSDIFSTISERLNKVPPKIAQLPMTVLNPPQTFTTAIIFLASTDFFDNCFASVLKDGNNNELGKSISAGEKKTLEGTPNLKIVSKKTKMEALNRLSSNKNASQGTEQTEMDESSKPRTRRCFPIKPNDPKSFKLHLSDYEHFLGLSPAVMTIENFSHMLLLMSSVMNDLPEKLKSTRFMKLDPPANLLQGLGILYAADDIEGTVNMVKAKSFASLTLQEVSDFTLTLSKVFHDAPDNLKKSSIADLNPPKSVINAVTILTSLLCNSMVEGYGRDEVELHDWLPTAPSQDKFFDAVDSVTSLDCSS